MKLHYGIIFFAALCCLLVAYQPAQGQTAVSPVDQMQTDAITRFVDLLLNCVLKLSEQDQIDMVNSANNLAAKAEQLKELCDRIKENPFRFLDLVFALAENNQLIISEAFKIIDFRQFDKWVQLVVDILLRRLEQWTNQTTATSASPGYETVTQNWNVTWVTSPSNSTAPPFTWPTVPSNFTMPPWWPSNSTAPPFTWPTYPSNSTNQPFTWPTYPSNFTFTPYPNGSWPTIPTWWPQNNSSTQPPITWPTFPANFTLTPYPNGTWPNYTMPTAWPTGWPQNSTAPPVTWPTFPANFTMTPYPNGSWPNYTLPTGWPSGWPTGFPNYTWPTGSPNYTWPTAWPTGSPNYTWPTGSPNNDSSTNPPFTWPTFAPSNTTSSPPTGTILKDPSYCAKYTISDCSLTPSDNQPINPAPYICVGLCTCSPKLKCLNNGLLAYDLNYQCMCICDAGFTGTTCEISVARQREMCLPSIVEQGGCLKESVRIACPSLCAPFSG